MASLPTMVEDAGVESAVVLPAFPEELKVTPLLQLIRSIRDKIVGINEAGWTYDELPEYDLIDRVNALAWRVSAGELELSTIGSLQDLYAYDTWILTFHDGYEFLDETPEARPIDTLSADAQATFEYNQSMRSALRTLVQIVESYVELLNGTEA